jgi:Glycosyl transferase family 2
MKEPVYIIIPVFNRKQTTLTCLERLKASGDLFAYHVVIVDDASTDGTAAAIAQQYPEAEIITGSGDLWWTGAMALGMTYAISQQAQHLIWLNDDCIPAPGVLSGLVEYMRAHPNTVVAPACYAGSPDAPKIINNGFTGRQKIEATPGEITPVEGMSGWCVGLPATVVNTIGVPDAHRFPHYSGDDMYTLKATRAGFDACLIGHFAVTLIGPVRTTSDLRQYVRPGLTPIQTFQSLFWHKKSPYRLPTKWFCFIERYGFLTGLSLFCLKASLWIEQWFALQVRVWFGQLTMTQKPNN